MASGAKILKSSPIAIGDDTAAPFYFSPQAQLFSVLLVFLDGAGLPVDGSLGSRDLVLRTPDSTGRFVAMTLGSYPAFPGDVWTSAAMLGAVQAVELQSTPLVSPVGAVSYRYELLVPEQN